jgi:hypothetical protein
MIKKYSHLLNSNGFFISLIVLVLVLVYFKSFYHGLIYLDDDTLIYSKFSGMDLGKSISFSFTSNYLDMHYYRPVTLLSLIADSLIGGQSYFIYHLTNFLLHLLTGFLIYFILRELGISALISFLTTMFFALSPIHTNAVGWIAGRGDLLAGFFSAAALMTFILFTKNDKAYLLIFVSVLLFLAFLSKEVSLVVPFLFLVFYFIEKKNYVINKNSISVLAMVGVVIGSYYLLRGIFLTGVHIDKFSFTTYYKNILVLPETVSKFFIPVGIKPLAGIDDFTSAAGTIILVVLFIIPFILRPINKQRYYFGYLWFVLILLPGMVFRTMGQDGFYYWDCRSYLPAIGLLFIIEEILNGVSAKEHQYRYFVFAALYLILLGTITFIKVQMYENPFTYWDSVKSDYPDSFLPYIGLFNYYEQQKEPDKAENQLLLAINVRPEELSLRNNLLNFYTKHNFPEKALALLKRTLVDDKIYSDQLAKKYISMLVKLNRTEDIDYLLRTYRNDKNIFDKINSDLTGN